MLQVVEVVEQFLIQLQLWHTVVEHVTTFIHSLL